MNLDAFGSELENQALFFKVVRQAGHGGSDSTLIYGLYWWAYQELEASFLIVPKRGKYRMSLKYT